MCELSRRGLAVAQICTEPFVRLGTTQARVYGMEDLPLAIIPHPLGGLTLEMVEGRALVAIPRVLELIRERVK